MNGMASAVIARAVKPADFLKTKNKASVMKLKAGAVTGARLDGRETSAIHRVHRTVPSVTRTTTGAQDARLGGRETSAIHRVHRTVPIVTRTTTVV